MRKKYKKTHVNFHGGTTFPQNKYHITGKGEVIKNPAPVPAIPEDRSSHRDPKLALACYLVYC